MGIATRILVLAIGLFFSVLAMASSVVESITGSVRAGPTAAAAAPVSVGQRINAGTTVVTGAKSLVTLRFDDGQVMLLGNDTEFRVAEYSFSRQDPAKDSFVFDLLRGAARSVTAVLTRRNSQAYALRVPQATLGIRGTDFMVALVNPAYMSVLNGTISVANAAGTVTFSAGATATVASATSLATSIAASALPASVTSTFSQLGSIPIAPTEAAAGQGAQAASGAASGGVSLGTVGLIGAAVAAAAALASDNQQQQSTSPASGTTATTSTTGTR